MLYSYPVMALPLSAGGVQLSLNFALPGLPSGRLALAGTPATAETSSLASLTSARGVVSVAGSSAFDIERTLK